jgi:hypothetical protein
MVPRGETHLLPVSLIEERFRLGAGKQQDVLLAAVRGNCHGVEKRTF